MVRCLSVLVVARSATSYPAAFSPASALATALRPFAMSPPALLNADLLFFAAAEAAFA